MNILSIRGAITAEENTKESIINNSKQLLIELVERNNISKEEVISIFFSATKDLDAIYPAEAARDIGFTNCSLMCFQEMFVPNSLMKCIRVTILLNSYKSQSEIKHTYLKEAEILRPDLT
ncbi:chorismate mutase [Dethiothermospora halolimnae]|uniref:chorismate mutase n=1 Tax=Dethiothermospora halolimnae TaxID=3114390 RepID=UPI003CCBB127